MAAGPITRPATTTLKEVCSMKQKKTTKDEQEALRRAEEYELIGDLALVSLILVAAVIAIAIIWGLA